MQVKSQVVASAGFHSVILPFILLVLSEEFNTTKHRAGGDMLTSTNLPQGDLDTNILESLDKTVQSVHARTA